MGFNLYLKGACEDPVYSPWPTRIINIILKEFLHIPPAIPISIRGWIEFFDKNFFSIYSIFHDCNLLVYRWNWIIKSFAKTIHWEVSLICDFGSFSTYLCIFHCILPVPNPKCTIILLLLPNIMFRCCCYTCTEHLSSRYVKKTWVFLVYWNSANLLPIFGIFQCIPHIFSLMYTV
jgi:hypothetical protein